MPFAMSVPSTVRKSRQKFEPGWSLTITPGWIVSVAPVATVTVEIARDRKPYPANPDRHRKIPDHDMPAAKEAQGVEQGNERENDPCDERIASLCHFSHLSMCRRGKL
jgi:hypothetical protein